MTEADLEMIAKTALRLVRSQEPPHRYMPKAIGEGPGWQVWDYLEDRHVPLEELVEMTPDQVMQKIAN